MRTGFGKVELVVVLCIALVIAGLVVTALVGMREKGNLAQCENNLRQVGEAVYLFRDQRHPPWLPPSRLADGYATWAVELAPYLDQRKTRSLAQWDLGQSYFDQPEKLRQAQVLVYYCPARRGSPQISVSGDTPDRGPSQGKHFAGALSDYACAAGDGDPRRPWTTAEANGALLPAEILQRGPNDTILKWRGRTDLTLVGQGPAAKVQVRKGAGKAAASAKELRRGTSQTIFIGEKHVPIGEFGRAESGDGSVYNGGRPANFARIGGPRHGLARSPEDSLDLTNPTFGSYHPGLCNFLMADGSVRGIAPGISGLVLGELIVRDDR
jgi:prepilin-type processing-associated H-X9-DG protein